MEFKLPFGHKDKEEVGYIPTAEVKKLRELGKSDREIIAELKNKGHSFQSIEKAMLQVLKSGVSGETKEQPKPQGQTGINPPPQQNLGQSFSQQMPGYNPPQQPPGMGLPTRDELIPRTELRLPPDQDAPLEMQTRPVDLIEEVVEGVVEEKFEKLDKEFEFVQKGQDALKENIETLKVSFTTLIQKTDKSISDAKKEMEDIKLAIDDLSVKCNALEKAFKQFLPDLTEKFREKHLNQKKQLSEPEEEKQELL